MKKKQRISRLSHMLVSLLVCLVYLMPFYVVLMVSLKPVSDTSSRLAPPASLYLQNYAKALQNGQILNAIKNNAVILVLSVLVIVVVGSMAAYPLARVQSRANELVRRLFMGIMMITPLTILVGLYSILSRIKAISTYWGIVLVLSAFGVPMAVFLYSNFISAIPKELDEAAMIDGCNPFQTFFLIVLPMLKPTLVSVGILEAMWVWNDYLLPTLVLDIKKYMTIPMLIQRFRGSFGRVEMGPMMACIMLTIIPIIIVYLAGQKYIIKGMTPGAVKG